MEDDDIEAIFDEVPGRVQALRDIAADLATAKTQPHAASWFAPPNWSCNTWSLPRPASLE